MMPRVVRHEVVQPLDQSYRIIPLTQGKNAIVDVEDYGWLSQSDWFAYRSRPIETFYAARKINGRQLGMHRVILCPPSGYEVDHIDRNGLNNRRENLRVATVTENLRNRRRFQRNQTGLKGAYRVRRSKKWFSSISVNGKRIYLGRFGSAVEASEAYDICAIIFYGEFANPNRQHSPSRD